MYRSSYVSDLLSSSVVSRNVIQPFQWRSVAHKFENKIGSMNFKNKNYPVDSTSKTQKRKPKGSAASRAFPRTGWTKRQNPGF